MNGEKTEPVAGMGRHLSMLTAWGLSIGYAVGWGAFVMPGTSFLPVLSLPEGYADWAAYIKARPGLAGVYASLGLAPLYDVCGEIVEIARAGGLDGVADLLPSLEEMHAEIVNLAKRGETN